MTQLAIKTLDNDDAGVIDASDAVFAVEPRSDVLARIVRWQLAKRRQGSHKTKSRSELRGGKKKPWRQKGTGRARQGSINAPHFRGGGTAFGPVVRSHHHQLNRRFRRLGLKMALSLRCQEKKLIVLESLKIADAKTAIVARHLKKLAVQSALIIADEAVDVGLLRATRNLPHIDVLPRQGLNVYAILKRESLLIVKDSVKPIEESLK